MSAKRQKNQLVLAFAEEGRSEAPTSSQEGTETLTAKCETERPASHEQLMEEVCERENCWQAYKQARIWDRLEKRVPVSEFTFPGAPFRLDFGYRRNDTRGFVHTLSVTRSPADAKLLAYTADHIQKKARFASEFAVVTDVPLLPANRRHWFVRDTLRDGNIEPIPQGGFAVWVAKLRPMLLQ